MSTISEVVSKLKDREYRRAYVDSQILVGIPFQIRSLRKQRDWSQERLAEEAGMLQPRISAIEKPGRGKLNLETLERIAAAFDIALQVRFVSFSELIGWSEGFEPDAFGIQSFAEEYGQAAAQEHEAAITIGAGAAQCAQAGGHLLVMPLDGTVRSELLGRQRQQQLPEYQRPVPERAARAAAL